jgi:hypothetical protein
MHRLHAVAYAAPGSTIAQGAATSLSSHSSRFIHHRARRRLGYPAALGLDLVAADVQHRTGFEIWPS